MAAIKARQAPMPDNRHSNDTATMTVMTMVIAVMMLCAAACQRPVMATARFIHLPSSGWVASAPLMFEPDYNDTTAVYDLILVLRHSNRYPYRNITLAVDVFPDGCEENRKPLDIALADEYGNWSGAGFGSLYQVAQPVVSRVAPREARRVAVWHTMSASNTLTGIIDIGIIARPVK